VAGKRRDQAARWTARTALAGVSLIAAVASYFHALSVVRAAGARPPVAYLVPFLADLVILGASAALLDASRQSLPRPRLATLAMVAGIGVTVAMNVAAGISHGVAGALVAGWPALAFILALESLVGLVRRGRGAALPQAVPAAPGQQVARSLDEALRAAAPHMSQTELAAAFGMSRTTVRRKLAAPAVELAAVSTNGSGPDE
jgi:peptidoglycan/LPS O-acetylase OafA/YrhL